uniref:Uncharacterized protein n=1 Tax=Rhizophora mucronata TaxID=61149 RepID=A0A2P2IUJ5_RHIMU
MAHYFFFIIFQCSSNDWINYVAASIEDHLCIICHE